MQLIEYIDHIDADLNHCPSHIDIRNYLCIKKQCAMLTYTECMLSNIVGGNTPLPSSLP